MRWLMRTNRECTQLRMAWGAGALCESLGRFPQILMEKSLKYDKLITGGNRLFRQLGFFVDRKARIGLT